MPAQKKANPTSNKVEEAPVVAKIVTGKQKRIQRQREAEQDNRTLRRMDKPTPWEVARRKRAANRAHLQWTQPGPLENQSPEFIDQYVKSRAARRRLASK